MSNKHSSSFHFCGLNGFGQFRGCAELAAHKPTEFRLPSRHDEDDDEANSATPLIAATWSYNAMAIGRQLHLSGAVCGHLTSHSVTLDFTDRIRKLATNDRCCLVLLEPSAQLHRVCIQSGAITLLNFIDPETEAEPADEPALPARRKRIFPDDVNEDAAGGSNSTPAADSRDRIVDIACTHTFGVALSARNRLFCIPSAVHRFRRAKRIVKLCAGAEHVLLLSANGDVYVFGSSLRGQLGTGEATTEDRPVLLEALAGIRCVDIAAGCWHSAAVSAFGDLYTWGWNTSGQTGRRVYADDVAGHDASAAIAPHRRKLPTVFATADVIDLPQRSDDDASDASDGADAPPLDLQHQYEVVRVWCGSRHTLIRTACGRWLACGWNRYGQLGLARSAATDGDTDSDRFVDRFTEVVDVPANVRDAVCGSWSTVFVCSKE